MGITIAFVSISIVVVNLLTMYYFYKNGGLYVEDRPNHRSMHEFSTKKSAGTTFIPIFLIFFILTEYLTKGIDNLSLFYIAGMVFSFFIGVVDDRMNLSSKRKILQEYIFFLPFAYFFISSYPISFFEIELNGVPGVIFFSTYIIFIMNLCNFMDGLDLYLTLTMMIGVFNSILFFHGGGLALGFAFCLISVLLAFALFNFPPARLFMGDAGSLPIGFTASLLPFLILDFGSKISERTELTAVTLFFPFFFTDGIITIFTRLFKGENILTAHRSHLYQRVSLSFLGKAQASFTFSSINLFSGILCYFSATGKNYYIILIIAIIFYMGFYFLFDREAKKNAIHSGI